MSLVLMIKDGMDCGWIVDDGGEGQSYSMEYGWMARSVFF